MQGAVLRGTGSASTLAAGTSGKVVRVLACRRAPVAMYTRSGGTSGARRRTVAASNASSPPASGKSCFGRVSRDAGQNLVPDPPAITTA